MIIQLVVKMEKPPQAPQNSGREQKISKEKQVNRAWEFFLNNLQEHGNVALDNDHDFPQSLYPDFVNRLKAEFDNPIPSSEKTDNRFTRKELLLKGDNLIRIFYGYEGRPTNIQAHRVRGEKKTIISEQELKDLKDAGLDIGGLVSR